MERVVVASHPDHRQATVSVGQVHRDEGDIECGRDVVDDVLDDFDDRPGAVETRDDPLQPLKLVHLVQAHRGEPVAAGPLAPKADIDDTDTQGDEANDHGTDDEFDGRGVKDPAVGPQVAEHGGKRGNDHDGEGRPEAWGEGGVGQSQDDEGRGGRQREGLRGGWAGGGHHREHDHGAGQAAQHPVPGDSGRPRTPRQGRDHHKDRREDEHRLAESSRRVAADDREDGQSDHQAKVEGRPAQFGHTAVGRPQGRADAAGEPARDDRSMASGSRDARPSGDRDLPNDSR